MAQTLQGIFAGWPPPRLRPTPRRLRHYPGSRQVLDNSTRGQRRKHGVSTRGVRSQEAEVRKRGVWSLGSLIRVCAFRFLTPDFSFLTSDPCPLAPEPLLHPGLPFRPQVTADPVKPPRFVRRKYRDRRL